MKKKGQLNEFIPLAIGIAVLAITLTVAFLILERGEEQSINIPDSTVVTNETVAAANGTLTALANSNLAMEIICTEVLNATPAVQVLATTDYTCGLTGITPAVNASFNLTHLYVSYTWKPMSYAYNSTLTLTEAADDVPGWIPIVIIVFVGSILLGLVALFRRK